MKRTDQAIIAGLTKCIRLGLSNRSACAYVGVSEAIFYRWLKTRKFKAIIDKAHADRIAHCLTNIQGAIKEGHWQAAAWILERCHPDEFALRHEITGKNGDPIQMKLEVVFIKPECDNAS